MLCAIDASKSTKQYFFPERLNEIFNTNSKLLLLIKDFGNIFFTPYYISIKLIKHTLSSLKYELITKMAENSISCLETVELPNTGRSTKSRSEIIKVYPTNKHVFITHSNVAVVKTLRNEEEDALELPLEPVS